MAWHPEQENLRQLAGYLKDALNARDSDAQRRATLVGPSAMTNRIYLPENPLTVRNSDASSG